jgi:hypothetical protein
MKNLFFRMASSLEEILNIFYVTIASVLTLVCLIGNSFTCYIFTAKSFRRVSMFFYLAIGTVVNILMLLTIWPVSAAKDLFKFHSNLFSCKFFTFITFFLSEISPWMITLGSLDRLISVKYLRRFQFRNKLKYQIGIVFIIAISIALLNLPILLYITIGLNRANQTRCGLEIHNLYIGQFLIIKTDIIALFFPFVLMLFSTITIGQHLIANKKKISINRNKFQKELQYVKTVVSMDFFFFITNAPAIFKGIIQIITYLTGGYPPLINDIWFKLIADTLLAIFFAADFFVYYACNKLFRKYFKSMIYFKKIK